MSLTLAEGLREARNLPTFSGSSEYVLSNYLRDVNTVLSLVSDEHKITIKAVLANRLQGKALRAVESLLNPTWEQIIAKLREEFGVRRSFLSLRNEAMSVSALSVEELHHKLGRILGLMNTKYGLDPEENAMFSPVMNERMIFDVYLDSLTPSIKTLLIQNGISTIDAAYSYYIANDLMKDVRIKGNKISRYGGAPQNFHRSNGNKNENNNFNRYRANNNGVRPNNNNNHYRNGNGGNGARWNGSGQYRNSYNMQQNSSNQFRGGNSNDPEPMELGNLNVCENFRIQPLGPSYP